MSKALTLSLIIPVYNAERHLEACLKSIADQTVMPDEVIIVNNNSTDRSTDIARRYPFVKIINENKQGIVYARNAGFNTANGNIIGRIDADTILPPGWAAYVKKFYSSEEHQNHALTGGGYFYNIRLPRVNGWIQSQMAYRMNRFLLGHYITWGSNMAITKQQWQAIRGDICMRDDIHEDLDVAIHLHRKGYEITYRTGFKVGTYLGRIYENQHKRTEHLHRWPQTLKAHDNKLWWMGTLGNWVLGPVVRLFMLFEYIARALGRPALK